MKWNVFYILTKYQFKSGVSFNSSLIIYLLFIIIMNNTTTQQQSQDEFKQFIEQVNCLNQTFHQENWLKTTKRFNFTYWIDKIWIDEYKFTIYFECWKHYQRRSYKKDDFVYFIEYVEAIRDMYYAINY